MQVVICMVHTKIFKVKEASLRMRSAWNSNGPRLHVSRMVNTLEKFGCRRLNTSEPHLPTLITVAAMQRVAAPCGYRKNITVLKKGRCHLVVPMVFVDELVGLYRYDVPGRSCNTHQPTLSAAASYSGTRCSYTSTKGKSTDFAIMSENFLGNPRPLALHLLYTGGTGLAALALNK